MDVSITTIMPVYNKINTIRRALDSALSQKNLDYYKILIIEDGSNDGSREIVCEYENKYPNLIEVVYNNVNCGLCQSIFCAYERLITKYFTVLDADDYWICDEKLFKAISFLEDNQDYSIYASNYYIEWRNTRTIAVDIKENTSFPDAYELLSIQTSATVFRNNFSDQLLKKLRSIIGNSRNHPFRGDTFRNLFCIHFGKMYYENSLDSVYYYDEKGIYSELNPLEKNMLGMVGYYDIIMWYLEQWKDDISIITYCLIILKDIYNNAVKNLADIFHNYKIEEWKTNSSVVETLGLDSDDIYSIIGLLCEYSIKIKRM